MRPNIQQALAALAAKQHGNVSHAQLLALGLGRGAIKHRTQTGTLHRLHRGVYSVGRAATTPLERAAAAVLACGPGAALSHGSAMSLWGIWKRWDSPIEVSVTIDRRPKGITVHHPRTLHRHDIRTHLGIRTTTPARTLFDVALRVGNLTRTVNDALHSPFLTESQLREFLARHPTHPTTTLLLPFVEAGHGPTRSELEDDFLRFCRRHGLPRPQTNALVGGYLVDAYFPPRRLIVELDSWRFHSSRRDFETDRNRDADHLSDGIPTVRVTHERMTGDPDAEAARLAKILASRG